MDLSTFGPLAASLARAGLPTLGTLLGDTLPFPLNLLAKGAASAVLAILGVDPNAPDAPAQAAAAVQTADPDKMAKLQAVEQTHKNDLDAAQGELDSRLKDVQDARATELQYVKAGSVMQYGAVLVSAAALIVFGAVAVMAMAGYGASNPSAQWVVGAGISGWTAVLGYWIGSSKGSSDKTDALTSIAHAAVNAKATLRK